VSWAPAALVHPVYDAHTKTALTVGTFRPRLALAPTTSKRSLMISHRVTQPRSPGYLVHSHQFPLHFLKSIMRNADKIRCSALATRLPSVGKVACQIPQSSGGKAQNPVVGVWLVGKLQTHLDRSPTRPPLEPWAKCRQIQILTPALPNQPPHTKRH